MRTTWIKYLILSVVAGLLLMACSPRTVSPTTATVAPTPVSVPAATLPQPTSQDIAWAKVVEAAKKEGKVTLYTYTFIGDIGLAVAKGFKDRYGITVDIIGGRGAEQLERLKTEQRMRQMVADIFESASTHTLNAKKMGLTINSKDLPALQEKDAWVLSPANFDPDGHAIQYTYHLGAPHINTKLVKISDEPKSWYDILNPSWKGKIVAPDPTISTGLYNYLLPLMSQGLLRKGFVEEFAAQKITLARSPRDVSDFLARGEYPLGISSTSDSAVFMAEGAPVKVLAMKEGIVISGLAFDVIKDSPSPNAARLFANWILSKEGQTIQAKARSSTSMRKDVPNSLPEGAQVTGKLVDTTSDDIEKLSSAFADTVIRG